MHQRVDAGQHRLGLGFDDYSLPAGLQAVVDELKEIRNRSKLAGGSENGAARRAHGMMELGTIAHGLRLDDIGMVLTVMFSSLASQS